MTNRTALAKEKRYTGNRGPGVYKEKAGEKGESDLEINTLGRGKHNGGRGDWEVTKKEKISIESEGRRETKKEVKKDINEGGLRKKKAQERKNYMEEKKVESEGGPAITISKMRDTTSEPKKT